MKNFVNAKRERVLRVIQELKGSDRVAKAELASRINLRRRTNAFLDEPDRLDHEGMKQAIDREPDDILNPDRRLADRNHRLLDGVDKGRIGIARRNDLDKPHPRDGREEMRANETRSPSLG